MLRNLPAYHALSYCFAWSTAKSKRASNSSENACLKEQEKRAATREVLSQRFLEAGASRLHKTYMQAKLGTIKWKQK